MDKKIAQYFETPETMDVNTKWKGFHDLASLVRKLKEICEETIFVLKWCIYNVNVNYTLATI